MALCKLSSEREWSIPAHSICSPLPNSLLPQTCVNGAISSVVCGIISGSGSGNNVMIISNTVGSALCSAVQCSNGWLTLDRAANETREELSGGVCVCQWRCGAVRNKEREEEGLGMDETRLLLASFSPFASPSAHSLLEGRGKERRKEGRKEGKGWD